MINTVTKGSRLASLLLAGVCSSLSLAAADWSGPAPEQLPQVNVRYEDAARKVVIVEGENYRAKVRLAPVAIMAIEIDGKNLLSEPIIPGFVDSKGTRYEPLRRGIPSWKTYQGQSYKSAKSAAARVNVWSASPYYWDAHVLDIPLVPAAIADIEQVHEAETVQAWEFDTDPQDWGTAANDCAKMDVNDGHLTVHYDGEDPWFVSPVVNKRGPFMVKLRLRSTQSGTAQLYYATKRKPFGPETRISFDVQGRDAWQDVDIPISINPTFMQFRIDPPGEKGRIEFDRITLKRLNVTVPDNNTVVRGEIVFHTFSDRLNIEFRVDPEKTGIKPAKASWSMKATNLKHAELNGRGISVLGPAALLGNAGETYEVKGGKLETPLRASRASGNIPRCWWVLRPFESPAGLKTLFHDELTPLSASHFSIRNGRYLGYDAAAGLHTIDAVTPGSSFNAAYDNPNRRFEIPVVIRGDGHKRHLLCKSISHAGILPATVLADENGFMLPTPVLSCKNFGGEREEPDDTAFGHAFFPVELAAKEEKAFQILHLFQNWGDHMLKQVSSIRFFHIYWHLSTGVSETTCYTIPSMKINGVWVRIPDYRPYSGAFWPGQPQHDCKSWPGLLQYQSTDGEVRLVYEKTVFESIAPNLAHFTMQFKSSDGAARATAKVLEIPQSDQMRTFVKIRYDFDKDVSIRGDARDTFKWLNVNDKDRPKSLVYLAPAGKSVTETIKAGPYQTLGEPLGTSFPFVGTHGMPGNKGTTFYSSLALIRSFKARLGGKEQERVFFSSQYDRKGNYWLTSSEKSLTIKKGDFVEAELMLVAHAEGTEPLVVPERERRYYGTEGPRTAVTTGRKISDFPATVDADKEVVALTITGGSKVTPIITKGYEHWTMPLLWVNGAWQNQQAHGGDGYQVNPDGKGKYRFTFLVKHRQGHPCHVVVTRAACTTGISKAIDQNGYLKLTTDAAKGEFSLKAPMQKGNDKDGFKLRTAALFAPGKNTIESGAPASTFVGTGASVRQIPLTVEPKEKTVVVTVTAYDEESLTLTVTGAATLTFGAQSFATPYRLSIDGKEQVRYTTQTNRTLSIPTGSGTHTLTLSRFVANEEPIETSSTAQE